MQRTWRYRSQLMASARFVCQRIVLKGLIVSITRVSANVSPGLSELKRPYIVVANHSSHLDAPLILTSLPRRLARHVATGAAADYFFTKWWLKAFTVLFFNAFPVERSSGTRRKRGVAGSLLRQNVPILLFPEGSRDSGSGVSEFQAGSAALSIGNGVPCVPAAIVGAADAMPRGTSWPRPGRPPVSVNFGEPVRAEPDESPEHFAGRLRGLVEALSTPSVSGSPSAPATARAVAARPTKKEDE